MTTDQGDAPEERHRTGFSAWPKRSECDSPLDYLKGVYHAFTMDGPAAGIVDHGLNVMGFVALLETMRYLPPVLEGVLPIAEYAQRADVQPLALGADRTLEQAVSIVGQGAESAVAMLASVAAGYVLYKAFDWLGDDYRPERISRWVWDRTGKKAAAGLGRAARSAASSLSDKVKEATSRAHAKVTPQSLEQDLDEELKNGPTAS